MFNNNQYNLLNHLLAYGPNSRKNLAKVLKISTAAVTMSVNNLIEKGIVIETDETISGRVGRKEIMIDINPDFAVALGLDMNLDYIRFSSCNLKGEVLDSETFKTVDEVVKYIKGYVIGKSVLGMTVLIRGYISKEENKAYDKSIFDKLDDFDFKIEYINNVEALGIMHKYYFYDDSNYLLVKYGSGVGSAICVNNHFLNQEGISNSELGHVIVDCTNYKKLEDLVSYESFDEEVNDDNIIDYLLNNEEILNQVEDYLVLAILNANVLLALDKVILAGKVFVNDRIFNDFKVKLKNRNPELEVVKIENYEDKRMIVGSIVTIFNELMNYLI